MISCSSLTDHRGYGGVVRQFQFADQHRLADPVSGITHRGVRRSSRWCHQRPVQFGQLGQCEACLGAIAAIGAGWFYIGRSAREGSSRARRSCPCGASSWLRGSPASHSSALVCCSERASSGGSRDRCRLLVAAEARRRVVVVGVGPHPAGLDVPSGAVGDGALGYCTGRRGVLAIRMPVLVVAGWSRAGRRSPLEDPHTLLPRRRWLDVVAARRSPPRSAPAADHLGALLPAMFQVRGDLLDWSLEPARPSWSGVGCLDLLTRSTAFSRTVLSGGWGRCTPRPG